MQERSQRHMSHLYKHKYISFHIKITCFSKLKKWKYQPKHQDRKTFISNLSKFISILLKTRVGFIAVSQLYKAQVNAEQTWADLILHESVWIQVCTEPSVMLSDTRRPAAMRCRASTHTALEPDILAAASHVRSLETRSHSEIWKPNQFAWRLNFISQ